MATKVDISPKIVLSISSLYNDTNRIFMEYIDNSIDSADQYYYDLDTDSYLKNVEITIKIIGNNARDGRVVILDNCYGITNFTKIVNKIGNSDKKAQAWTNGQFGYGIYSFMAACEKLEVTSKIKGRDVLYIPIERSEFNKERQEDIFIPDPKVLQNFDYDSGTKMVLSKFDKEMWRVINVNDLKEEIEKHFELILKRKGLSIKLIDENGKEYFCVPFDYNTITGEIYEDRLTDLHLNKGQGDLFISEKIKNPVHIFLKITENTVINKPPIFISKGRRICEIKDVKSFKSRHKSDIWGHPNFTGYIDLSDLLGPTIARTDFTNTRESRALFNTLIDLESLIIDFLKKANKQSDDRHYQQLEDILNKALSKLARLDAISYRTEYLNGGNTNLEIGSKGDEIGGNDGGKDFGSGNNQGDGQGIGEGNGDGVGRTDLTGTLPDDSDGGDKPKNQDGLNESEFMGQEKKKSGCNIKFVEGEQVDSETGKPCRSIWDGSYILIYKNHPDFEKRVRTSLQGESKITDRLISYLASEITVHYKDLFYNKMQNGQPSYDKKMFEGLVEFIYQLEDSLKDLNNKNLSEFEKEE